MLFESVVNSVKSARGHSPPKRHSASPRPYLSSLYRRKVTLFFAVTVLNISDTQLCFTSPWLSDSTHFISITTLLISFPLLCHSLPSHRLSTPFHRFTSHFNSAAFLRHPLTPLLFAIPIQNYSKTQRRYTLTSHTNAYTQLRFDFHCPLVSALCFSGAPHICSVSYHNSATPVRFCALLRLFASVHTLPGPLFASPTPCTTTLFQSITIFSFPRLAHFNSTPSLYGLCYSTPALINTFA